MLEKIYVITDLGPGDGGKGGVVHSLSRRTDASVIIKRGGAQGSHGVRTSSGESFNFSQWGCGTFDGIPTFCSEQMIISPVGLENESDALSHLGIYDPYKLLSVDPSCICATPFHRISSQFEELLLGDNPRGTIGSGVGRAYRMYNEFGDEMTIRASQLTDREQVRKKLEKQVGYYRDRYANVVPSNSAIPEDRKLIEDNLNLLHDDGYIPYTVDLFENVGKKLQLKELSEILQYDGTAVVECSHGVLTDAELGLQPHVSAIRTLPKFTCEMLRGAGYGGQVVNLGVHRAYEIRHGAGPMPTYDPEFTKQMIPGSHKDENRWQGIVRAGPIDLNLIRHALDECEDTHFDGLCLTWFDQILENNRTWFTCIGYQFPQTQGLSYTDFINQSTPLLFRWKIPDLIKAKDLFELIEKPFHDWGINLPLYMLSIGPTEVDKIYRENI